MPWPQSQVLLPIFLSQPLLHSVARGGRSVSSGGVHGSVLVSAWSYHAPSHCAPFLGQVPLMVGMEHLPMPLQPLYLLCHQPGTSSFHLFFQPAPSLPFISDQSVPASCLFYSRAVFPADTLHTSWSLLAPGLSSGRISGSLTTVSPAPSPGRCSSGVK